ncbi:MAG: MATE family efflux transporter [Proteobacteria bacterium]|nr:MATE family efflux transporter [Pseudomonadota bacterium]
MVWPIIVANASSPVLGLVDTAVIGHVGTTADLGAIGLAAIVFNFIYWSFGFLRMGTTGFVAQAAGADQELEVRAALGRALAVAACAGSLLVLAQSPLERVAFWLSGASPEVEALARDYFLLRIWAAPASLATFALLGTLIGLGQSRMLLRIQLCLNAMNVVLDVLLAGVLGMGVRGVALGTAFAEWTTLALALSWVLALLWNRRAARRPDDERQAGDLGAKEPFWAWDLIRDRAKLLQTLSANTDLMLRTLLLIFGFAWFVDRSAQLGNEVLAGNQILLQFVTLSAFFLDGFANVAETLVGRAVGARDKHAFDRAVRLSTEPALATAAVLTLAIVGFGEPFVQALTPLLDVRESASRVLPYAAGYVLVAAAAFQLDGIFIGATRTRDMRNGAAWSVAIYLVAWFGLREVGGNPGLWLAFTIFAAARGLTLAVRYPALRRTLG